MSDTPLLDAIENRNSTLVTALLAGGHDPNEVQPLGRWTGLMYAAQRGDAALVRQLLDAGADPNHVNDYGATPLTVARGSEALDAVLASNATLETRLDAIRTDLVLPSGGWRAPHIAALLPDAERDLARCGIALVRAFRYRRRDNDPRKLLAEADIGPVVQRYGGLALIHGGGYKSRGEQQLELPRRLLDLGADPNEQAWGRSPLTTAITARHAGFVSLLLERGADVNQADENGVTPLIAAVGYHERNDERRRPVKGFRREVDAVVAVLLEAGADVNATIAPRDKYEPAGRTALMWCLGLYPWNAGRLLDAGADVTIADAEGWTALHFCHVAATGKRLKALGADITAKTTRGETPLHSAIIRGWTSMVKWLWRYKSTHVPTADGQTPAELARRWKRHDLAAWLER